MIGKSVTIIGSIVIAGLIWFAVFGDRISSSPAPTTNYGRYDEYEDIPSHDEYYYEDLAYDHWDEVKEYMSGTETIDACSDSGCYSLDADITDGYVETLYFPNGGYIYPDAEIDESGFAEGYDNDSNYWEFQIDMDSSMVQDAISEWATDYAESREDYENNYRY